MSAEQSGQTIVVGVLAETVQASIDKQVKRLRRADEFVPSVFRILCRLARNWKIAPEDFRVRLVRARLASSRASEIKAVLEVEQVRDQFIARTMTWHDALAESRQQIWTKVGRTDKHRAAAALIGWMRQLGISRFEHPAGTFELTENTPAFFQ